MALDATDARVIAATAGEAAEAFPWLDLLVLFGSAARGRLRPDSDVDLGWLGRAPSGADEAELLAALDRRLGRDVHLTELRTSSDLLRIEVVRTGLLAFERRPGAWTTFAAESMSRWFDIEPLVTMCADAVRRRTLDSGGAPRG